MFRKGTSRPIAVLFALAWLALTGCSDSTGPNAGPSAETGSIEVRATTTGATLDPDGYFARVGRRRQAVGVNAVATIAGLASGEHNVQLIGLTSNCAVTGANPQTVTVMAGETVTASFEVACEFVDLEALGKIAFTRGGDIWVMEGHGGNPVRLTNALGSYKPVWSPDGTRITFTACEFDCEWEDLSDIWVIGSDGSNPVNLTSSQEAEDYSPAWSPDGTKIAFVRSRVPVWPPGDIWIVSADGSNPVNLTDDPAEYSTPVWSPDGTKIAFVRADAELSTVDVWVMDADRSNRVNLTNDAAAEASPAWSPDGAKIAFVRGDAELITLDVWVMDADGTDAVNLTDDAAAEASPAWSPDGAKIVFASDRDGTYDVYVMDADGSNPANLTDSEEADDYSPVWSSDGTKIAFASWTGDDLEIWVMDADGSHRANLTNYPAGDYDPAWEPKPK